VQYAISEKHFWELISNINKHTHPSITNMLRSTGNHVCMSTA